MTKKRMIEVLTMIEDDMKADAENMEGKPFNGRTVAEALGYQGAAISALANIFKEMLMEVKDETTKDV